MSPARPLLAAAALLAPVVAFAADDASAALRFLNNALLLSVLAALGLGVWWLRRRMQGPAGTGGSARVLPVAVLGPRERISVVEFEGRRLLVGITPQQVSLLCELDRGGFGRVLGQASGTPAPTAPAAPATSNSATPGATSVAFPSVSGTSVSGGRIPS